MANKEVVRRSGTGAPSAEDLEDDDNRDLTVGPTSDGGVNIDVDDLRRDAGGEDKDERRTRRGGEHRDKIDDRSVLEDAEAEREAEDRRARRREERRDRKDAAERREEERDRELTELREQLGAVHSQLKARQGESVRETVEKIDGRMGELRQQYETARLLKEKAYAQTKDDPAGSAKAVVDADEAMYAARDEFGRLGNMRERVVHEAQQEAQQTRVGPELKRNAAEFIKDLGDWYDPNGSDRDSRRVRALDRELSSERGRDPNSSAYWKELRRRVEEEIPHQFEEDRGRDRGGERGSDRDRDEPRDRPQRRSHVGGGGRETAAGGGGGVFHLSAARMSAIKDAGMWDDPKQKARMIERYRQQDRDAARNQRKE